MAHGVAWHQRRRLRREGACVSISSELSSQTVECNTSSAVHSGTETTMFGLECCIGVLLMLQLHHTTAIDRLQLFPFGAPQGDERMDVGDDVSSSEIQLRTRIVFYDDVFSSLYVSANGRRHPVDTLWQDSPVIFTARCITLTVLSQDVRPSVRPSVRLSHAGIVSKWQNISSNFFHRRLATCFHTKLYGSTPTPDGDPLAVASNVGGTKKSRFSANISLYLGNDKYAAIVTMAKCRQTDSKWYLVYRMAPFSMTLNNP